MAGRLTRIAFFIPGNPELIRLIRAVRRSLPPEQTWVTHRANVTDAGSHVVHTWRPHVVITTDAGHRLLMREGGLKCPILMISGRRRPGLTSIGIDERALGQLAVDHFLRLGYRQLVYFGVYRDGMYRRRIPAIRMSIKKAGIEPIHYIPDWTGYDWRTIDQKIKRWLTRLPRPVGVICENDARARQLAEACLQFGIRVPDEVAILGIGNDPDLCETVHPPLSSLEQPWEAIGKAFSDWIVRHLGKRSLPPPIHLRYPPAGIAVRASTDRIAVEDPQVAAAMRYIHDHAGETIHVRHIARAANVSRRTLEMRFLEVLGHSPAEELRNVRFSRIRRLLRGTDYTVDQIARQCGYASGASLTLAFKRYCGQTPRDYRQQMHEP